MDTSQLLSLGNDTLCCVVRRRNSHLLEVSHFRFESRIVSSHSSGVSLVWSTTVSPEDPILLIWIHIYIKIIYIYIYMCVCVYVCMMGIVFHYYIVVTEVFAEVYSNREDGTFYGYD